MGGGGAYPGAEAGVALWAAQLSCDASPVSAGRMDLDGTIDGEETRMERYEGCSAQRSVELWTIEGAGHIPSITSRGLPTIWSWLSAHVR